MSESIHENNGLTIRGLIPFLLFTFILTWGIAGLLIFYTDEMVAIFGEIKTSNPLYILAVYSPGFAAVFLVWRHYGISGLGRFFRRLALWRISIYWWLFLLLVVPAIFYIGAAMKGTIDEPFPFTPWTMVFPALAHAFFLGTIEEFGWRGLALPLLQRKYAPFWAGLIVGIIWAVWHIPAFLLSDLAYSNWAFVPFFFGVVSASVILTCLFNHSRGSLLIAYLFHFQMMNPIWPDAQPYESWLYLLVACIVVWFNREAMFSKNISKSGAVTEVVPG